MEFENAKLALCEAVNLDQQGRAGPAIDKYIIGIEQLLHCLSDFVGPKKDALRQQVEQYMSRVEGDAQMPQGGEGGIFGAAPHCGGLNRYESIFAKCMDAKVTEVHVEDPWLLSSYHQLVNFVKFCELLVRSCANLRRISLLTQHQMAQMSEGVAKLGESLRIKHIELAVNFAEGMHDREIRFNNGWLVKMGRGLDIYKNVDKFTLGSHDYHLRPCKATLIEIFKTNAGAAPSA